MERESFVFYRSFYNCLKNLAIKNRDALSMAIFDYALNGEEPELDGVLQSMFDLIRPQLDANNRRYENGCKGGQYGAKGGRPPKTWDNSQKPQANPKETPKKPQANPKLTPNDNVNDNVNDNEKESEGKREANNTLDANASRGIVGEKRVVGKTLSMKLGELGLEPELIELAETYDKCKKGKKLSKFQDAQLKIRVNKLRRCGFDTIEGMRQVLENSIAGGYEGIFELKQNPVPIKPRVSGNLFH